MILDRLSTFADKVSVANAAGTYLVGDVIDLETVHDIGNSRPIYLVLLTTTDILAAAAGTIKFQLVSDAQAAIATDGTASIHFDTGTFVTDVSASNDLDAGQVIAIIPLPLEGKRTYERYVGVLAVIATQTVTQGNISAFLTLDPTAWKAHPDALN